MQSLEPEGRGGKASIQVLSVVLGLERSLSVPGQWGCMGDGCTPAKVAARSQPLPAQENRLSVPRSNFSREAPNLDFYVNSLLSRTFCLPPVGYMPRTRPPRHLWVGALPISSYLPPETLRQAPFRCRALKSNQTGISLKRDILGSSAGKAGGQPTGLREKLQAPESLGPRGHQTSPPSACLCVLASLLSAARLSPYKGEMAATGPTSLPASSQLPTSGAERATPPPPGGKSHG